MKAFEYASPREEAEVLGLLSDRWGRTEVLAGGTDLLVMLKKMLVTPDRVVNIKDVESLRGISADSAGVTIGATTTLDDLLASPELDEYPAIKQAIAGISSQELQCQGTIGGELCRRPDCWYYRNGYGLLAKNGRLVSEGRNRYHAIFGNQGPARFVHPSRIAPALVALNARVRVIGPGEQDESILPLEFFFRTPKDEQQRETVLEPNQLLTHILLEPAEGLASATYEVRHGEGPDNPLASAAAVLRLSGGVVQEANVVLGHVAPTPWTSPEAVRAILGRAVTHETAERAGDAAVERATPLSENGFKVQLARVAVKRAILLAAGLETGGF